MGFITNSKISKISNDFVHDIEMESNNLICTNKKIGLKNFQKYISCMNELEIDIFFTKVFSILINISKNKIKLTKSEFTKIIAIEEEILESYLNGELDLSVDDVNTVNDITNRTLFYNVVNKSKFNLSFIKDDLIDKNISMEKINDALIWMSIRISCFQQCYAKEFFKEACYD